MSDPTNTQTSQLEGYCLELQRLAVTLTGMLSQCEALGTPLGEDRSCVEQLGPVIGELELTIRVALTADGRMRDDDEVEAREAVASGSGARVIEWSKPDDQSVDATPQSPEPTATQQPESPVEEPAESTDKELTADDLSAMSDELVVFEGDDFPGVEKCAELMMSDLSAECVADIHEKGEVTLKGTNESLPLPGVFQFLAQTSKTGTLRVKTSEETMRFDVVAGDLVFSSSDNPPKSQLLGEILIEMKLITRDALEKMLTQAAADATRLGSALEDGEFVSHENLATALKQQIKNRLARAFGAPDSAFTFSEGGSERPHHRIRMNVTQLLLESL